MTRVLIAFDKFKDALTARQACEMAAKALQATHPGWQLDLCPLADGGDGFCETLTRAAQGRFDPIVCTGPRGNTVNAQIGYVDPVEINQKLRGTLKCPDEGPIAVIEMASASGLALLPLNQRDPWQTSSRGTGELLATAVKTGATTLLLGVGGSATNDLGLGAIEALGFKFYDDRGELVVNPVPTRWEQIVRVEGRILLPRLLIACDVTNPLLGPTGAAATFGPQKGLREDDLPRLEQQAKRISELLCDACGQSRSLREVPGTGAAGGFAFGLMVAAKAELISGAALVSDWLDLPTRIAAADIVITGEGRFDRTSLTGKGPGALIRAAVNLGKPIHVFAGSIDSVIPLEGLTATAISPSSLPLAETIARTEEFLSRAIAAAF